MLGNLSPVGRKLLYHVLYWFAEGVARRGSLWDGVVQGFGVVCVFTYHFGMLVVRCVWNPFFLSLANQGAYFISLLNIRFKAPLRYALVVCLHFIPPNHEHSMNFYFKSEKYWRSYDIDTEI